MNVYGAVRSCTVLYGHVQTEPSHSYDFNVKKN